MVQIAGLASNRGRNLRNLQRLRPGGAEIGVVVSNEPDAPVLAWAEDHDIPAYAVATHEPDSRREHERRVLGVLEDHDVGLVCLDGYMRLLSETFLDPAPLTLNVHPSLLPAFPGTDAWGDALEAGVKVVGCTVHAVTNAIAEDGSIIEAEIDGGPIVTQEPIPVYEGDERTTLKQRVLYQGEFRAYPRAVRWAAEDRLKVDFETDRVRVDDDDGGDFPGRYLAGADRERTLRYGENPHQDGAVYVDHTCEEATVVGAPQRNPDAKALSYNNYNDAAGALELIKEFEAPAAAVIKHTNPAGCATADTLVEAYERALATDPVSAFGGIVALNRPCDAATAAAITESFKEVVVAPEYTDDALATLRTEEDLRLLEVGALGARPAGVVERPLVGGRLLQDRDRHTLGTEDLEVVTERTPTDAELETMLFAWRVVKHVTSNAVAFATGTETVGVGAGQMSRVDAVRIAGMKADEHAEGKTAAGGVMASDAFFPFPDGLERAHEAGIEAVIQPGGSVNDDEVTAAADDRDMAMVHTGVRCFRHD